MTAISLVSALALTGCGQDSDSGDNKAEGAPLVVGASPVPQAKILEFVKNELTEDAGIELEIREFDDYVLPNEALAAGDIDANYFQHVPYLDDQMEEKGYDFAHGDGIHIEPFALFSEKYDDADDVPDGATVALTNDPSNQYRGLKLLEEIGLLEDIEEDTTALTITEEQNPAGLKFEENQPEIVVQQLDDPSIDVALINGNFILTAGLNTEDAIAAETVEGNPYANVLAWNADDDNPDIATLDELLHSEEVADFIREEWPSGSVFPGDSN